MKVVGTESSEGWCLFGVGSDEEVLVGSGGILVGTLRGLER